jgi:hypothetical protein
MDGGNQKGFISGFREIREKAKLAKQGNIGAIGEIEAAKALRSSGQNVHFQTPDTCWEERSRYSRFPRRWI